MNYLRNNWDNSYDYFREIPENNYGEISSINIGEITEEISAKVLEEIPARISGVVSVFLEEFQRNFTLSSRENS